MHFDSDGEQADPTTIDKPEEKSGEPAAVKKSIMKNKRSNKRNPKSIRSQIRSIQRLLANRGPTMASAARKKKEADLAELVRMREEYDRREKERKLAKEYHMVKFFERRKLDRRLEKIMKNGDKPEDAAAKQQIKRDLFYLKHYPKGKKYISLFPSHGHTEESRKRVEDMRLEIEGKAGPTAEDHMSVEVGTTENGSVVKGKKSGKDKPEASEEAEDDFFMADDGE